MFYSARPDGGGISHEIDRRGLSFNFLLENTSLSPGLDVRRAWTQAGAPTQTDNTDRPSRNFVFLDERETWPYEIIESPSSYVGIARADDEHRSAGQQYPAWLWCRGSLHPPFRQTETRPARLHFAITKRSADWYPIRSFPAICARKQSGSAPFQHSLADRKHSLGPPAGPNPLLAKER